MKILPPYYGSVFIMRKAPTCKGMRHIDLWRFKSMKSGKTYLVDVEAYEKHIYGIKFYLKSQAHLQEKYSFQTNDFEPRRIVLSCIYIMKLTYILLLHLLEQIIWEKTKHAPSVSVSIEQLSIPILVQKHLNTTPTNAIAHT